METRQKFQCLFEKLLLPEFELCSYYANNLIKHLINCTDKETSKLLESPFFSDLLLHLLPHINKTKASVQVFALKILGIIARNELQFTKIVPAAGPYLLTEIENLWKQDRHAQTRKVACIEAASALLSHHSGIVWLIEMQVVQEIFKQCHQTQTMFVLRAAYTFISDCLWKLDELEDETNLLELLNHILAPIISSPYHHIEFLTDEIESTLVAQLEPSVEILTMVLKKNKPNACGINSELIISLFRNFAIDAHFYVIVRATRAETLACKISQVITLLSLAKKVHCKPIGKLMYNDEEVLYFNIVSVLANKRMVTAILDFAFECVIYWSKSSALLPPTFERYGRTFEIPDQIITLPLVPLTCVMRMTCAHTAHTQPFLEMFFSKLANSNSERSVKAAYSFRELIENKNKIHVAIQSVQRILKLKGHISNAQACTIFQALFYVLKYFVYTDEASSAALPHSRINTTDDIRLITVVLDATTMLIKEHDINWHDSYEIICLYNTVINIMKVKILPIKCTVQTIDLITITVRKFLCPDLALLHENKDGSLLTEIGEVIRTNMTDTNWEVRDSAVSLLLACTELAFIKYPPFQKLILANSFISIAGHIALNDEQFYVQANALKCLAAATKMENIWKVLLTSYPDLYTQLGTILKFNQEGIVRKEAAVVLCNIYVNRKFRSFQYFMYGIMYSVLQEDLYWEVQIAALHFWKKAIQNLLAFHGMIDGKFPSVTFSQVCKKIVTLNPAEIEKRIIQIMNDLASIGCLTVLVKAMNEDINLNVMEEAISISKELYDVITSYDVKDIPDLNAQSQDCPTSPNVSDLNSCIKEEIRDCDEAMDLSTQYIPFDTVNTEMCDSVIASILDTDHCDLLNDLCHKRLSINTENLHEDITKAFSNCKTRISPNDFLHNIKTIDYDSIILEKRNWNAGVRDLNYVLDEVLTIGPVGIEGEKGYT